MTPASRRARRIVLLLEVLVVSDFALWHLARFSAGAAGIAIALGTLPWLLIAPPLWRGDRRRHVWATLLTAPYIAYGLMEVLANPGARRYAGALVLLSFALFVALTAYLRVSRPTAPAPT